MLSNGNEELCDVVWVWDVGRMTMGGTKVEPCFPNASVPWPRTHCQAVENHALDSWSANMFS